jgi:hypothetical protein
VRAGGGGLTIVLGADGPSLAGQAVDKENRPVANASVVLLAPGQVLSTVTDQNGQYALNNMPPGDYRLMAFADGQDSDVADPSFLQANLGKAVEVSLAPGERKNLSVTAAAK